MISYSGLGSATGGSERLYLNGHLQGIIESILEPFSWDLLQAQVRVGVNYVGLYDELALFNRSLTEAEVVALHGLQGGVAALQR